MKHRSRAYASDRERLAEALAELAGRGYLLVGAPWEVCCATCGWTEIARRIGAEDHLPEDLKTVWWHEQSDSFAFLGDPGALPQSDEFWDRVPDDDDEAVAWMEEHAEEAVTDSVMARLALYNDLVEPLNLHWMGDPEEIAAALRATGLRVVVPNSERECFEVLPVKAHFHAAAINGEVTVHLSGGSVHLTAAEARKLAKQVNAAAREAVRQGFPFAT